MGVIRVHFYEPNTNEIAIHSHRTNVSSVVIDGCIINEIYEMQESLSGTHQEYSTVHTLQGCSFESGSVTRYNPVMQQKQILHKGREMHMKQKELHLVRIPDGATTLCLFHTNDNKFDTSRLYFTPLEYERETSRMNSSITHNKQLMQNKISQLRSSLNERSLVLH